MTSEQPLPAQVTDVDALADAISAALIGHPGVVRLEPTVRSVLDRWTPAAVDRLHRNLRPAASPPAVVRDGLVLTLTDGVLNLQIDIATNIDRSALELAGEVQETAAHLIRTSDLTIGQINVTILAIERDPAVSPT